MDFDALALKPTDVVLNYVEEGFILVKHRKGNE